ncbi:MAG: uracil-DNA glycosylase [Firmicutes bacterium]|nr:uracil-DNA glycosylase [Bacillota bacterium]
MFSSNSVHRLFGNGWDKVLAQEFSKDYFAVLERAVLNEYAACTVFPPAKLIFKALETTDYNDARVVILGQDPYHGPRQANGIAFAVNDGVPLPPSLKNIYKEIESEFSCKMPATGSLLGWAEQGVLLLNASLTVRMGCPQSHVLYGWHTFTDAVIKACGARQEPLVFMLWGASAQKKKDLIAPHHVVLTAPHPSPLSAHGGFFGCNHFIKANRFLESAGKTPIDWTRV